MFSGKKKRSLPVMGILALIFPVSIIVGCTPLSRHKIYEPIIPDNKTLPVRISILWRNKNIFGKGECVGPPFIYFRESDGTVWKIIPDESSPERWFSASRTTPDGKRTEMKWRCIYNEYISPKDPWHLPQSESTTGCSQNSLPCTQPAK